MGFAHCRTEGNVDKFAQLAAEAEVGVCIFGNLETSDFEMLNLQGLRPEGWQDRIVERAYIFIGVVGFVKGIPRTALAVELNDETIDALSKALVASYESRISAALTRELDWMSFAQGLYHLMRV